MISILNDVKSGLLRPFSYFSEIKPSAYALAVLAFLFVFVSLNVEISSAESSRSVNFGFNFRAYFNITTESGLLVFITQLFWVLAQINVFLCFIAVSFRKLSVDEPGKLLLFSGLCIVTVLVSVFLPTLMYISGISIKFNAIQPAALLVMAGYYVWNSRRNDAQVMVALSVSLFLWVLWDSSRPDFNAGVEAYEAKNYKEAFEVFEPFASDGKVEAQIHLALMYDEGLGVEENDEEAINWYRLAAAQNNALAQNNLGAMYMHGEGVPKDIAKALELYLQAAEQGYAQAEYNLGAYYYIGDETAPDYPRAIKWLKLSADQGHEDAQNMLGVMHIRGEGVLKDVVKGTEFIRMAAEQGNAAAQNNLGAVHTKGEVGKRNNKEAARLFRLAAIQGYPLAQRNLGTMYADGSGVSKDNITAFMWFSISAENGDQNAMQRKLELKDKMTLLDISSAETRATKCLKTDYSEC